MPCTVLSQGQVLLSILLDNKLNSDKLEFGLDGGLSTAKSKSSLNLEFYFDIKLKNSPWYIQPA
jgi:hypothetical protein